MGSHKTNQKTWSGGEWFSQPFLSQILQYLEYLLTLRRLLKHVEFKFWWKKELLAILHFSELLMRIWDIFTIFSSTDKLRFISEFRNFYTNVNHVFLAQFDQVCSLTQVLLLNCLVLEKVNAPLFSCGCMPWLQSPSRFGPPFSCGLCLDVDAALPFKAIYHARTTCGLKWSCKWMMVMMIPWCSTFFSVKWWTEHSIQYGCRWMGESNQQ